MSVHFQSENASSSSLKAANDMASIRTQKAKADSIFLMMIFSKTSFSD